MERERENSRAAIAIGTLARVAPTAFVAFFTCRARHVIGSSPSFGFEAVGVGQKKTSVPKVRRSDIGRAKSSPLRIEPERGQSGEHPSEPFAFDECGDLFHEDETGSNVANEPEEGIDKVALVVAFPSLSRDAVRLARDPPAHEIDGTRPRGSGE